jgi:hypothetical protein
MKLHLVFILLLGVQLNIYSQEKHLIATPIGFQTIGIKFDKPQNDFVTRTYKWIDKTYENPEKVVQAHSVNGELLTDRITIIGYEKNVFYHADDLKIMKNKFYYNVKYKIDFWYENNEIKFHITILEMKNSSGFQMYFSGIYGFFDKKGEVKEWSKKYNQVDDLEIFVNNLFISYRKFLLNETMTSDEALELLKKLKTKLDLGLITQEEYDSKKKELIKFID